MPRRITEDAAKLLVIQYTPRSIAVGAALGILPGFKPLFGLKTLLAFLLATNTFLSSRLSRNADAIADGAAAMRTLTRANAASTHFGELKYWLSDLSVSLLVRSERNADTARAALDA